MGRIQMSKTPTISRFISDFETYRPVHTGSATNGLMHRSKRCHYSITSSAATRSASGIVNPRLFAVLRLITSSNVVGCCTGMSSGRSPRNSQGNPYCHLTVDLLDTRDRRCSEPALLGGFRELVDGRHAERSSAINNYLTISVDHHRRHCVEPRGPGSVGRVDGCGDTFLLYWSPDRSRVRARARARHRPSPAVAFPTCCRGQQARPSGVHSALSSRRSSWRFPSSSVGRRNTDAGRHRLDAPAKPPAPRPAYRRLCPRLVPFE